MIKKKAILTLNNSKYEILRCCYTFTRDTDAKGRPTTGVRGGDIRVVLESGKESPILSQMLIDTVPSVKGSIELLAGEDEACIRRIAFEEAYVHSHSEALQTRSSSPMMLEISISPIRLDVNDRVRLDRRWPETSGFHWQEYKEEEKKYAKNETKKEEDNDKSPTITKLYWKDSEGKEILNLPEDGVATLCAETENTNDGDTIEFDVELADGSTLNVSGTVDANGLVEIPNVNLGYK